MAKDPLPIASHLDIARYLWRNHNRLSMGRQIGVEMIEQHRTVLRLPSPFVWMLEPAQDGTYELSEGKYRRAIFTREELDVTR